jgi:hypothetical protein
MATRHIFNIINVLCFWWYHMYPCISGINTCFSLIPALRTRAVGASIHARLSTWLAAVIRARRWQIALLWCGYGYRVVRVSICNWWPYRITHIRGLLLLHKIYAVFFLTSGWPLRIRGRVTLHTFAYRLLRGGAQHWYVPTYDAARCLYISIAYPFHLRFII